MTKFPTDFDSILKKIDSNFTETIEIIEWIGFTTADQRHFIKVLNDLYHDIEVSMGVYDE
jgi:hypothetical protein